MAEKKADKLPHIVVTAKPDSHRYRSTKGGGGSFKLKLKETKPHGESLRKQLEAIKQDEARLQKKTEALLPAAQRSDFGITIEVESDEGFELRLEGLDYGTSGIELLSTRTVKVKGQDKSYATVHVPFGKLKYFYRLVDEYITRKGKDDKAKNADTLQNIHAIRTATVAALWTDTKALPDLEDELWFEIWLRAGKDGSQILEQFKHEAHGRIILSKGALLFPERTVVLARCKLSAISHSDLLLDSIAEIRAFTETAEVFVRMPRSEQSDWAQDFLKRLKLPDADCPHVCLLDTGVNRDHQLLSPVLGQDDVHAYDQDWGAHDHHHPHGHGTPMAGLAIYGDLTELLLSTSEVSLEHRLESVKILPPVGSNDRELYGYITESAAKIVEAKPIKRKRVFSLPITAPDVQHYGRPSSWSAEIDRIVFGGEESEARLMVISAGNTKLDLRAQYPNNNLTESIQEPAQAWNAITVGAYTEKSYLDPEVYPDVRPLAPKGALSPASTTSLIWNPGWPIKPDVVCEGGNMALNTATSTADYNDALDLLTTHWKPAERLLAGASDTSAATSIAARMLAIITARYPSLWPETIRGLLIHSADWNDEMLKDVNLAKKSTDVRTLIRTYGYGIPSLERAIWSASNSVCLISESVIQPYIKDEKHGNIKLNEMHLHNIPWPRDALQSLGEEEVELRVTLSYFIEPNPGERGYGKKFRYASHGLRFEVKTATEAPDDFRRRINKLAQGEVEDFQSSGSDSSDWIIGANQRGVGSLHSDIWKGTAADLAEKNVLAVFPVNGWWRERAKHGHWEQTVRYALLISIRSRAAEIDLYSPVANLVTPEATVIET